MKSASNIAITIASETAQFAGTVLLIFAVISTADHISFSF